MKRRSFLKASVLTTASVGAVAASTLSAPALASGVRRLKMVTTWPKNFPGLGTRAVQFAKDVAAATDGKIKIKVMSAGDPVPAMGVFDAVSAGKADMYHAPDYYWQGKHKAFPFFAAVPFGLTAQEMVHWLEYGGGQKLWDELSAKFNIKSVLACATGIQMGGWFKKEINSIEDFKGLRMRIPGIGGEVMRRIGATPVTKSGGEIYMALSQGNIDASEWVGPWNDLAFGFYKIAPYYYTSAFHEPSANCAVGFNLDVWESFSKSEKVLLKAIAASNYQSSLAEFNAHNSVALRSLVDKHGVKLRKYTPEIMTHLADISADVVREIGATDDLTKRIYNSFMKTRKAAMEWGEVGSEPYLANRRLSKKYGELL